MKERAKDPAARTERKLRKSRVVKGDGYLLDDWVTDDDGGEAHVSFVIIQYHYV